MKHKIRFFLTLSFLFFSVLLFPQEKDGKTGFQPSLGQEGKDVRWFPTPQELVNKMLEMAKITPGDLLIDLGSGDGRMVITAAKQGVRGIGIEYNTEMVELSKRNAAREGVKDLTDFIRADIFKYDFSGANVLTMFLLPEINMRLRARILRMKPGTRVVSTAFTMQDWKHDDLVKIDDRTGNWTTAYLWIVPAKVGGIWRFKGGVLELIQKFQAVKGRLTKGMKTFEITEGRLNGNDFTFVAGGTLYNCSIENNIMIGTAKNDGKITDLIAEKLN